ncbi:hypothetical protein EZV62_024615 [Acer yangbiense]|uniref:Uncharacterized protein n=1 Tax=Acer yangbiense TaxID=1000413 RepID=A0A5C7GVQ7_9ROSI|nr:hypothetical protein EZV62_024615 [Acer yangbiense]
MKEKAEVFEKFKEWNVEVKNQTGRKIKYLRSDNRACRDISKIGELKGLLAGEFDMKDLSVARDGDKKRSKSGKVVVISKEVGTTPLEVCRDKGFSCQGVGVIITALSNDFRGLTFLFDNVEIVDVCLKTMDFFMQNSRPSSPPMSLSSEDRMGEFMQDAIAFKQDITQNLNNYMLPSWLEQGVESAFEGNLNISIKATTQNYKEDLYQSEEEDLCKIMLEMNKKLMSISEELRMAMDEIRLMQAEIQARDKALEITKKKEIGHLVELARSKQEKEEMLDLSQASSSAKVKEPNPSKAKRRKAKRRNKNPLPLPPPPPPTKNHQQGIISNPITMCHHCHTIGHIRPLSQEYERHGTRGNFEKREKYRHVRKKQKQNNPGALKRSNSSNCRDTSLAIRKYGRPGSVSESLDYPESVSERRGQGWPWRGEDHLRQVTTSVARSPHEPQALVWASPWQMALATHMSCMAMV